MSFPFKGGTVDIAGSASLKARGSLSVSGERELLVVRSSFGGYNPDGSLAKDTLRVWGDGQYPDFPGPLVPERIPAEKVVRVVDEPVVWAGGISDHYGHFLTEFVSRLWPLLPDGALSGLPVVFCGLGDWEFVHSWLRAFGVKTIDIPEHGAVRFRRIYVPEPAWRLDRWIAPEMLDIHRHARRGLDVPQCPPVDLLWLSRSGLGRDRVPYDEALFEWLLTRHMTIVKPEEMKLGEQVAAFEASRVVAGVVGSAFHTALMTNGTPECIYLCPNMVPAPYVSQGRLLEADSTFLHSLTPAAMRLSPDARRPASFRLLIPETVRALKRLVLPDLLDIDPLIAAIAEPERLCSKVDRELCESQAGEMEMAVAKVVLDPLSLGARMSLGAIFEEEDISHCALEQFGMVADLTDDYVLAPLRAARLLHRNRQFDDAADMATRALAIDSGLDEARSYLTTG